MTKKEKQPKQMSRVDTLLAKVDKVLKDKAKAKVKKKK